MFKVIGCQYILFIRLLINNLVERHVETEPIPCVLCIDADGKERFLQMVETVTQMAQKTYTGDRMIKGDIKGQAWVTF